MSSHRINPRGKHALFAATKRQGIPKTRAKHMLAMGMIEGDLTRRTDNTPSKQGTSAECHGMFNLNTAELKSVGASDATIRHLDDLTNGGHVEKAMDLSVKLLDKLFDKYGMHGTARYSRTGSPHGTQGMGDYTPDLHQTIAKVKQDSGVFFNDMRYYYPIEDQ